MALLITEPAPKDPDTPDWQALLNKLVMTSGEFFVIDFTEKNTVNVPQIMEGTRFEVNESFFYVQQNETINGFSSITNNKKCYVYAKPNLDAQIAIFEFSEVVPTYRVELGGWFHPSENWRALISCFKTSNGQCRCKSAMDKKLIFNPPIDADTTSIISSTDAINPNGVTIEIEAGYYQIIMQGATGGKGGDGGASGESRAYITSNTESIRITIAGNPSAQGAQGTAPVESDSFKLWLEKGTLTIIRGYKGRNGLNGTTGNNADPIPNDNYPFVSGAAYQGGDGGDGSNGGDATPGLVLNNGKIVAVSSVGIGGKGAAGSSANIGAFSNILPNFNPLVLVTRPYWEAVSRKKQKQAAVGLNTTEPRTRDGSIFVYVT